MNDIPITTTFSPSKQTHTQFSRPNPDLSTETPQSNILRILPIRHFPPGIWLINFRMHFLTS
ncbi:hypothetical protein LOK49_LG11G01415 [Camellia lanceoleosa]|uniref:Uncharacterized protein n=1 Tax=Camellia lanceoleosa TaxID=1840588 RepID=A0ACC0G4I9_9ERIC|nr:hypothetical protein LOK49_LG11G01415 [Camellia lanceoleosa]